MTYLLENDNTQCVMMIAALCVVISNATIVLCCIYKLKLLRDRYYCFACRKFTLFSGSGNFDICRKMNKVTRRRVGLTFMDKQRETIRGLHGQIEDCNRNLRPRAAVAKVFHGNGGSLIPYVKITNDFHMRMRK